MYYNVLDRRQKHSNTKLFERHSTNILMRKAFNNFFEIEIFYQC